MRDRIPGINRVTARLSDGREAVYYYHRATGTKLSGAYGSPEFLAALEAARVGSGPRRTDGTLAGLIRGFEASVRWRKLAESTRKEYRRIFTFWDGKFGTLPIKALEARGFREDVLSWHAEFSATKPREADNRVTILARVLSWGAADRSLKANVLESFDRAYSSSRSEMIWLPEHIEAFMDAAEPSMQLALILALHTGQRQADVRKMAWSQYDGETISVRQEKTGARVRIRCTQALKASLDATKRRGTLILLTRSGLPFEKRYFAARWDAAYRLAGLPLEPSGKLHFHDLRGTAVTMLFEAGCNIAEVVAITGHTLRSAQSILDQYLARTGALASSAIVKLENRMEQERAKRPAKWQGEN